jgi:hypothetical protein
MNRITSSPTACQFELSDQLGAKNLPRLVKITFLSEVTFVLSSYRSPTFHEPIVANQLATRASGRADMPKLFVSDVHLFQLESRTNDRVLFDVTRMR